MAEYWTIQQAAANAELFAREFSNRQILLYGLGEPILQAPLGVEYEDRSFTPPKRYRKVGNAATDWMELKNIEAASKEEVNQGVDNNKMITPYSLSERLNLFSEELLGIPKVQPEAETGLQVLSASIAEANSSFSITLPNEITTSIFPIEINNYGENSSIQNILGGGLGQMVNIRRGSIQPLTISSNDYLKISSDFILNDTEQLDNITLQRLSPSIWVELTRKKFT